MRARQTHRCTLQTRASSASGALFVKERIAERGALVARVPDSLNLPGRSGPAAPSPSSAERSELGLDGEQGEDQIEQNRNTMFAKTDFG